MNDPPNRYDWQVASTLPFRLFRSERLGGGAAMASEPVGAMAAFDGSSGAPLASRCFRSR